ncbi:MAG TPA: CopG family transcriptional regulator [Planctomycetota bacterium]|jgi:hypothetical protein|nr:CopG family transcriptional regulator [Planctomycetota bacterium]
MSKRLQILLQEDELREIRRAARRGRMTVSEWVRQALRAARRGQPASTASRKLSVIREAFGHSFPTADLPRMLSEIDQGARAGLPE